MRPLNVLPTITNSPSAPRAPRCRFDSHPWRRPLPHSTASTTRSRVWTGLTLRQAAAAASRVVGRRRATSPSRPRGRLRARRRGTSAATAASSVRTDGIVRSRRSRRAHRAAFASGSSRRSRSSTCRTSKKNAVSGIPCASTCRRPKRLIVSWNRCGRSSSLSPIASPSSTSSRAGKVRTDVDDLRQSVGDVVEIAGEDAHFVAVAVHLDAGAVELPLDRRRPGRRRARRRRRRPWMRASVGPGAAARGAPRRARRTPP